MDHLLLLAVTFVEQSSCRCETVVRYEYLCFKLPLGSKIPDSHVKVMTENSLRTGMMLSIMYLDHN
jgi:hypothetical protein